MSAEQPAPPPESATSQHAERPPRLPFPLQGGERILELCRRHWFFLWPKTLILLLVAVVPVVLAIWLLSLIDVFDDLGIFFWIPAGLWLAYWAVRTFFNWYAYHNDIWVVTNQRIIDSFKPHPFNKRVSTADLVNIQDMSIHKSGIFASLMNFGDVICQTAGVGAETFRITGIPRPESVQLLIDRERDRERLRGAP
jgi:hypothetical protein